MILVISSSVGCSCLTVLWLSVLCVFPKLSENDQRYLILAFPSPTDLHYGTRFSHNKTMCHLYDPDHYANAMVTGTYFEHPPSVFISLGAGVQHNQWIIQIYKCKGKVTG